MKIKSNAGYLSRSQIAAVMVAMILGSFGIGTGEFAIMGVLQDVATGIGASVTQAGNLISAYAFGVVIGTPLSVLVVVFISTKCIKTKKHSFSIVKMTGYGNLWIRSTNMLMAR